jgi:hypothetical protein
MKNHAPSPRRREVESYWLAAGFVNIFHSATSTRQGAGGLTTAGALVKCVFTYSVAEDAAGDLIADLYRANHLAHWLTHG